MNYKKIVFFLFFWFGCLLLTGLGIYFFYLLSSNNYSQLIDYISRLIDKTEWTEELQKLFTPQDYQRVISLKFPVTILLFTIVGCLIYLRRNIYEFTEQYSNWVIYHLRQFVKNIQALQKFQKIIFCLFVIFFLVKSYFYLFSWPIQFDEAWTFLYYIKNSWLTPLVTPHNNHILYTLIAKTFYHILPFEAIYSIRFPLPLFAISSAFLLFYINCVNFNQRIALASFIIFLSIPAVIFYSLYARAYMLAIFFATVQLAIVLSLVKHSTNYRNKHFTLLISTVLGIYALPSFIYFASGTYLFLFLFFILKKEVKKSFQIVGNGCVALLITTFLYFPMILSTKLAWLTKAVDKSSSNLEKAFFTFSESMSEFVFNLEWVYLYPIILIVLFAVAIIQRRVFYWFLLLHFILPFVFILFQNQYLEERIFFQNVPVYVVSLVLIISVIFQKFFNKIGIVFILILSIWMNWGAHHQSYLNWSVEVDNAVESGADFLLDQQVHEVYNYFYYAKPALEYHYQISGENLKIFMPQKKSIDFAAFDENKTYEAVFVDEDYSGDLPNINTKYKEVWNYHKDDINLSIYMPKNLN